MNKEEKLLEIIAEILEIDDVTLATDLDPWDSLAMISFIAEAGEAFECAISPEILREAKIVSDLMKII